MQEYTSIYDNEIQEKKFLEENSLQHFINDFQNPNINTLNNKLINKPVLKKCKTNYFIKISKEESS